ncbi:stage II sporulation protein R [Alkalihalobacillus sp. AL-G]|uniref:stage II sporulation protein R n=1 Tax=Alkalihalobacillus sp. AL-G TaxID=2926399 RepID=UPI00272C13A5|nr:stage II sporulation protein R [Alkalihalobacillus sp. AL-G]WLD93178.1 stage II sporulation protein R [Alkalihalobacillus sp. AL-G]
MKRKGLILFLLTLIVMVVFYETQIKVANASFNSITADQKIPEDSIRLRILADSGSSEDQKIKRLIRDRVNEQITEWVYGIESLEEARKIIKRELPQINTIVEKSLIELGLQDTFSVEFGTVPFPTKLYGEYVYPAGEYEAVLITLGEGLGANWWCVLFPPLCFLDFENGDAVQTDDQPDSKSVEQQASVVEEEPEVKFFVVDFFQSLMSKVGNLFA